MSEHNNPHCGSSLDDFLAEQGILDECTARAKKRKLALELAETKRVFADFNNADTLGRIRLNCVGTAEDLARDGIRLREGQIITLYGDGLEATGQLAFSKDEQIWVVQIDWPAIKQTAV